MSPITKKDLNYIKKRLPKGWIDTIAGQTEKSASTVKMVMRKERSNKSIVSAAIALADLSEEKKNEFLSKLND